MHYITRNIYLITQFQILNLTSISVIFETCLFHLDLFYALFDINNLLNETRDQVKRGVSVELCVYTIIFLKIKLYYTQCNSYISCTRTVLSFNYLIAC